MANLDIYCLSLHNKDYEKIKSLNYKPVGLGKNDFNTNWLRDNTGQNISQKNKYYGEYTFHYWFWKNNLKNLVPNQWTGFCAYRRFWTKNEGTLRIENKNDFLTYVPDEWSGYNVILGNYIYMDGWSSAKIVKHGLKSFLTNPKYFFKKNQNLKLHFDSFHGYGNLDKAIEMLNDDTSDDELLNTDFIYINSTIHDTNISLCIDTTCPTSLISQKDAKRLNIYSLLLSLHSTHLLL